MINIGITGQEGFIGSHLFNTLMLSPEKYKIINFSKTYFEDTSKLDSFVSNCNVIVHLAAMNRHIDPQIIYDTNINLVKMLIGSLNRSKNKVHLIMSSSTQEEGNNLYGKSKKEGRELFEKWAIGGNGQFSGLIIPNVFGPFGKPLYNSVVATFCHKLANNEPPVIDNDGQLELIYVGELVNEITKVINNTPIKSETIKLDSTYNSKVSDLLMILENYKKDYQENGIIPPLKSLFEVNLFNTFRCYMDIPNHFPVKFKQNVDGRGSFVEVIRLNIGGQVSFSTTISGITRGNHFHTRKIERFAVIKGEALIQLRKIGSSEIINFELNGNEPAYVDMPVWYTHNIKNIGSEELYTIFWINEFYNAEDPDTYFKDV